MEPLQVAGVPELPDIALEIPLDTRQERDRIAAITLVFRDNLREEDIRTVLKVLGMLQHVICVRQHPADEDLDIAEERARSDLRRRLWAVLRD